MNRSHREGCYGMAAVNPHYKVEWRFESSTVYKLSALIYRDVESRDTVRWVIQHHLNKWARAFEVHTERTFHGWMTDLFSGGGYVSSLRRWGHFADMVWLHYICKHEILQLSKSLVTGRKWEAAFVQLCVKSSTSKISKDIEFWIYHCSLYEVWECKASQA